MSVISVLTQGHSQVLKESCGTTLEGRFMIRNYAARDVFTDTAESEDGLQ
jgi:hypothetical protein